MALIPRARNSYSLPDYLNSIFTVHQTSCNHALRSEYNEELKVPKPRIEFFRKSLIYSGPVIWNVIPKNIRQSDTLQKFKITYIKWKYSGTT